MQPAAALCSNPVPPPIAIRGRFFRFLAASPIPVGGNLPVVPLPGKTTACYVRRGRYPVRVRIDNQEITIMGPDWHEIGSGRDSTQITFVGNDESDAAIAWLAGGFAAAANAAASFHAPGSAYQYVIESCDELCDSVSCPPRPDPFATGTSSQEIVCLSGLYSLLDRQLARSYDRNSVLIQNQGPNPIKVLTLGDWDLFAGAGFSPTLGALGQILDAAPAPGQAGGSLLVSPAGWGLSFWGQALVANQVAGAATVVTES